MRIRNIYAIAVAMLLATTLGVQSASAQSPGLRSNIPFEFHAADKLFPAGTYIVTQVNPSTLRLQDAKGGKSVYIVAGWESPMNDGNWIVFHQYGNRSFLAGAYWAGSPTSLSVRGSRAEREAAKSVSRLTAVRIAAR